MIKNTRFLEDDYIMSNKVRSKVDLRTLDETPIITQTTMDLVPTILIFSTPMPHHGRRLLYNWIDSCIWESFSRPF